MLTLQDFLREANLKVRKRKFDESDYAGYCLAFGEAEEAAESGKPYYASDDAGGVANSYKHVTTTAQWGIWVDPETLQVVASVGRQTVSGRHVKCPYYGGKRQYFADFKKVHDTLSTARL